jgi:hypothetical protein
MDKFIKMTYESLRHNKAEKESLECQLRVVQEKIDAEETFLKSVCKPV